MISSMNHRANVSRLDRRAFGRLAGASVLGAWAGEANAEPAPPAPQARTRALMKVGTQHGSTDEILAVLAALGVDNICAALPSERFDERWIENASRAGIPALKYNMSILGVVRTEPTRGRGGAKYSTFSYAKDRQEPPLTEAGPVPADAYWERITHFLERVIPVAEEHKVRMACHPHDPGMPADKGYRGVHTVLGGISRR